MKQVDVTAVVTVHREGLLLKPTLDSLSQSAKTANLEGITTEIMIVMDRPDALTSNLVERYKLQNVNARIFTSNTGDVGMSRNLAASNAMGKYVAFLDGDDLWGKNWLSAAFNMLKNEDREVILHPEVNVYFGRDPHVFVHIDMEDQRFDIACLALTNYWTSLCFATTAFLLRNPYPASNLGEQIGFEDWSWNLASVAAGALHKVVPGTGHAIRMKHASLLRQTSSAGCMAAPSDAFIQVLKNTPQAARSRLRIATAWDGTGI
ncbi:MAG: glycosyltransferase [Variovorax paradoxus]|nr:glycosyltransferase [Variovorax paradoxus]MBW8718222.1 glycosyltransferase [Variovorax paradoxus]